MRKLSLDLVYILIISAVALAITLAIGTDFLFRNYISKNVISVNLFLALPLLLTLLIIFYIKFRKYLN